MSKYIIVDGSRVKDLEGTKFGKFSVKRCVGKSNRYAMWECVCECGNIVNVSSKDLIHGRKKDCGCSHDLKHEGERYGRLTIVKFLRNQEKNNIYLCRCDCGKLTEVSYSNLISNNTRSCGCLREDNISDISGTVYGFLTAIKPIGKTSRGCIWKCKCRCGNELDVPLYKLQNGDMKTCGCFFAVEKEKKSKITLIDKRLKDLRNDNTKVKGIRFVKGKWQARISFCKKNYYLGRFLSKEDAIQSRIIAEKHLYTDFIEWYNNEYCNAKKNI